MSEPTPEAREDSASEGPHLGDAAAPEGGGPGPLWRAFPLGVGAATGGYAAHLAVVILGSLVLASDGPEALRRSGAGADRITQAQDRVAALQLLAGILLPLLLVVVASSIGVVRGALRGRVVLSVMGGLLVGLQLMAAGAGKEPSWMLAVLGLLAGLLVLPRFGPWFEEEARREIARPADGVYAAAMAWASGWAALLLTPGTRFEEVFQSMGVALPGVSQAVIAASRFLADYGLVAIPLAAGALLVLLRLRLSPTLARAASLGLHAFGALVSWVIAYAWIVPIIELQRALGQ